MKTTTALKKAPDAVSADGYEISKVGGKEVIKGDMMPMVTNDGPHYGDNIKLQGPGVSACSPCLPPSQNPHGHFGCHVDKGNRRGPVVSPFELSL